jgi:monoamine oxidase
MPDPDVIVIGGGLSGLRTAQLLVAQGVETTVLEARGRVGGRTHSREMGEGAIFDLGGQWIGPTQDRLRALVDELGIETFPTHHSGTKILELCGKRTTYENFIPSVPFLSLIDLQRTLSKLDRLRRQVPTDRPQDAKHARKWDATSVESWKQKHCWTEKTKRLVDASVRTVFGAEPAQLSLLHFLFYLNAGGGLMKLMEIEDGAQEERFVTGAQSLSKGVAASLGDRVVLNAPVRRVEQSDHGVTVMTDGGELLCKGVVVAMPPMMAGRIQYEPALPIARDQLTQRFPMGSTTKVFVLYEQNWWREGGLSGEAISDVGPATFYLDNTSHDEKVPCLLGFIVGNACAPFDRLSPDDRRATVVDQLVRLFGEEAAGPSYYDEKAWSSDPWTGGCPTGSAMPGALTAFGDALREPVGRIHWAGTETAHQWNGYLEGALEAAERVVKEITHTAR